MPLAKADSRCLRSCGVVVIGIAVAQGISLVIGVQLVSTELFAVVGYSSPPSEQLAIRVLALYENDRHIRVALIIWLTLCHCAMWAMALISIVRFSRTCVSILPSDVHLILSTSQLSSPIEKTSVCVIQILMFYHGQYMSHQYVIPSLLCQRD